MMTVRVSNTHRSARCPVSLVARSVRMVVSGEGRGAGDIGVVCVSDGMSRRMNRRFLGHAYATDVISFPLGEGDAIEGELYVNLDRARVQARQYGVTRTHELVRLVVHGTLHLTGYDDRLSKDRMRMRQREDFYLARLFPAAGRKGIA